MQFKEDNTHNSIKQKSEMEKTSNVKTEREKKGKEKKCILSAPDRKKRELFVDQKFKRGFTRDVKPSTEVTAREENVWSSPE